MRALHVLSRGQSFEKKLPAVDGFVLRHPSQIIAKIVFSKNRHHQRAVGLGEGSQRPIDILGEVAEDGSFDLMFAWRWGFSACTRASRQEGGDHSQDSEAFLHSPVALMFLLKIGT